MSHFYKQRTGSACPVSVTADFIKFLRTLGSLDGASREAVMAVVQKKGQMVENALSFAAMADVDKNKLMGIAFEEIVAGRVQVSKRFGIAMTPIFTINGRLCK